jgi:hypothetical protein
MGLLRRTLNEVESFDGCRCKRCSLLVEIARFVEAEDARKGLQKQYTKGSNDGRTPAQG